MNSCVSPCSWGFLRALKKPTHYSERCQDAGTPINPCAFQASRGESQDFSNNSINKHEICAWQRDEISCLLFPSIDTEIRTADRGWKGEGGTLIGTISSAVYEDDNTIDTLVKGAAGKALRRLREKHVLARPVVH